MSERLKPCPFCGGKARAVSKYKGLHWFECANCLASTGFAHSEEEAIAAWNRRADRWIPVSERLPENYQAVLVTYRSAGGRKSAVRVDVVGYSATYRAFEFGELGTSFDFDVLAWRPLPEPYEEEGDAER